MLLRSELFSANSLESFRNTEVGVLLLLPAIGAAQCTRASASQGVCERSLRELLSKAPFLKEVGSPSLSASPSSIGVSPCLL